jgi:ATP-binding cassette, subfamily B, bacterial MsbA
LFFLYLSRMKGILEIYRYTFTYKWKAILVIIYNLLFVIFNLISMVLFIPFLQLIFPTDDAELSEPVKPVLKEGVTGFISYISEYYTFFMETMVQQDPKGALFFVCVSVMIAFLLKNLFRYGAIWHQSELRMAVVRDVRDKLFTKAMQLPLSYYSDERKGDIMSRMQSDVGEIEIAVVSMLELIYREPIAIIINVAALFYWSPELTLFSFALLPLSAFVISRISKSLKRTAKQGQEQMGSLYSSIDEGLGGIRVIKAFNAVPQILDSFRKTNLRHQKLITKAFRKRDLSPPLNETLAVGVMLCIVWFGGSMILDKDTSDLTGEEFIAFILVFSQLLRPIQGISTSIANLNKAKASQDRINEVLNADERIYERPDPVKLPDFSKSIRYEHVFFRYKDDYVLKDINLTIEKGKTIALVGESGSGKSTLADLLPRFYDVEKGTIYFDETPITDCSLIDLRNHIGIVSQESILFNASVRENIAFGMSSAAQEDIERAARIANAHNFIMEMESGYETNIGERGNKLSGGQKQRISIARAVLKNPPILILDEATSALDTESEKLVQEALENLMKDRTSIIIAHRLSTVRNADEIIVLSKGEIIERGSHDELMLKQGHYHRLCSLQGIE